MIKKISILIFLVLFISIGSVYAAPQNGSVDKLDNMPILEERIPVGLQENEPIANRGPEYRKFLAASVKIDVGMGSGSGTIVYYDKVKNLAYVASCGHLWEPGIMNVEQGKQRKIKCNIIVWYHNNVKLDEPKIYPADVVFYSYVDGQDTSLVVFKPDWEPEYFSIAPRNYRYQINKMYHSCGSDGGSEVAHYDVQFLGLVNGDIVTFKNSPRPGRSGGGLMDDKGYYIGTCWGTQFRDGSGKGYFTPLSAIHRFWSEQNGYEFLLRQKPPTNYAQKLPIKDKNSLQQNYTKDYILLPGGG